MTGIELITKERQEQLEKHGFVIERDFKTYTKEQLTTLAIALLKPYFWPSPPISPFDQDMWTKMASKPLKERLVIAGALLAAEIDHMEFGEMLMRQSYVEPGAIDNSKDPAQTTEDPNVEIRCSFQKALENLINSYSKENDSNTPDFILAEYLNGCLMIFNKTTANRNNWYGADKPVMCPAEEQRKNNPGSQFSHENHHRD